jgi:hypothetical protein
MKPQAISQLLILNKPSITTAIYGEPFVKRRGLFFLTVASPHGVFPVA